MRDLAVDQDTPLQAVASIHLKVLQKFVLAASGAQLNLGPDLQNILRQSYDYLTIMPKLRPTYDRRLIYKTSYNEWKAFHR